jgi:Flp pilus assembly protein TadG
MLPTAAAHRHRGRATGHRADGQVLVIFALAIVALFAAAGVAFDIGRFYSEKRFLQNAADAAALAAGASLVRGETSGEAIAAARSTLTRNLAGSPNGSAPSLPPDPPVYADGHAGDPTYLINGILVSGCDVRVAVQSTVSYTFGRIVGLSTNTIGGQAHVKCDGNMLPIAVRQFINVPGPNSGAASPCTLNQTQFTDFFATADTACLGTDTNAALRSTPNPGAAFDSSNPGSDGTDHGPIVTILGQGAQPSNGADFRGFVALDIRNFQTDSSQLYYNQVTAGTNKNTLKQMEADWILAGGYPGPFFPPVVSPPDPNDQVATMSGNDTGIAIDAVGQRFAPGDEILVAVYPGQTMQIPDFSMSEPGMIAIGTAQTLDPAGSFRVGRNQAFSGTVTMSTEADTLDPANPMLLGTLTAGSYTPNPVTPSLGAGTQVTLGNLQTTGATPGIYTVWIRGEAGSPYLTVKRIPLAINVGGVSRDFELTASASDMTAANPGDNASVTLNLSRVGGAFGGNVHLSVDGPLPTGIGTVTFSANDVAPANGKGTDVTLTIGSGTVAPGTYTIVVRASGMNGDSTPRKVTHLVALTFYVGATGSSGNKQYVDISGFAVMRIAAISSNSVDAYAISGIYADMNDPALRRGQVARLVPWNG